MHHTMFNDVSESQMKAALVEVFNKLCEMDKELYNHLELIAYKAMHGCHFTQHTLDKALKHMINEDGSTGGHWNLSQTNSLANANKIDFITFNEYDFNYVMNMLYSDYYGFLNSSDSSTYIKLAKAFLHDKDAPEGKAFRYYLAMR